jgi:hypothetical protein
MNVGLIELSGAQRCFFLIILVSLCTVNLNNFKIRHLHLSGCDAIQSDSNRRKTLPPFPG